MLTHPTQDQLAAMGLHGMAKAFADLSASADADTLTHGEWLALLLEREATHRHDRRQAARLRFARLRHQAAPEDIDWKAPRGLDRPLFAALLKGDWIDAADTAHPAGSHRRNVRARLRGGQAYCRRRAPPSAHYSRPNSPYRLAIFRQRGDASPIAPESREADAGDRVRPSSISRTCSQKECCGS